MNLVRLLRLVRLVRLVRLLRLLVTQLVCIRFFVTISFGYEDGSFENPIDKFSPQFETFSPDVRKFLRNTYFWQKVFSFLKIFIWIIAYFPSNGSEIKRFFKYVGNQRNLISFEIITGGKINKEFGFLKVCFHLHQGFAKLQKLFAFRKKINEVFSKLCALIVLINLDAAIYPGGRRVVI